MDDQAKVAAFFERQDQWRTEVLALRAILLSCPLVETFKWRGPVYTFEGGNVATFWVFKEGCALSFFKGVLLADPDGFLTAPGENSRAVRMARFTEGAQIAANADRLRGFVMEAIGLERDGKRVVFASDDLAYPEELVQALEADDDFAASFDALTPGRRRGYVLHFSGAKQSDTRAGRIEKARDRILDGKGMQDR